MMKIRYTNSSWPVYIDNVNMNDLTDDQIQEIGQLMVKHVVVIFKGQHDLTIDDEVNFASRFGKIEAFSKNPPPWAKDTPEKFEKFWNAIHRHSPYVDSVTGQLNGDGLPGIHGMKDELKWHCGSPWNRNRTDVVSLYGAYGTANSQTIYLNGAQAFADLPDEWKERVRGWHLRPIRNYNGYSKAGEAFQIETELNKEVKGFSPSAVYVNRLGVECLFVPFNQILGFVVLADQPDENKRALEYLAAHMTQEKYFFYHNWDDGDYLFWDNWNGLHKRPYFENIENRLLHRMQWNIDKIRF